ncbi:MAG: hypothetical protein F4023_03560 [Acidobacteria bacterium]|nr:hypothetical protein [Acidobacteriota bacterium]MYH23214.1 hypothetical protein [Acidobacteriota bacterium]MYK78717.1 hypothetical protein [Acidobacteriota bacterium]
MQVPGVPAGTKLKNVHFETEREVWSEYIVPGAPRVRVRVKTVVSNIQRVVDLADQQHTNPDETPVMRVSHSTVVAAEFINDDDIGGTDA